MIAINTAINEHGVLQINENKKDGSCPSPPPDYNLNFDLGGGVTVEGRSKGNWVDETECHYVQLGFILNGDEDYSIWPKAAQKGLGVWLVGWFFLLMLYSTNIDRFIMSC